MYIMETLILRPLLRPNSNVAFDLQDACKISGLISG